MGGGQKQNDYRWNDQMLVKVENRDDGEDDKVMGSLENNGSFVWKVVGGEKSVFTTQKKAA